MKKHFYSILRTISSIYGHYNLQNSETTESGVDNVVNTLPENLGSVRGCNGIFKRLVQREYTSEKIPSKHQLNEFSLGRSMVEMLGVLAIIGVLSVGAISGYSKAMFKYKLNKQAESFNILLNTAIQIQPDLGRSLKPGSGFDGEFFYKAHLIPDGMYFKNGTIYDIFNNRIETMYYQANDKDNPYIEFLFQYNMDRQGSSATSRSIEICRNLVTTAKENASDLPRIQLRSANDQTTGNYDSSIIYGNKYCSSNRKCLRKLNIQEIDDFCSSCNSENRCSIMFYIYFKDF